MLVGITNSKCTAEIHICNSLKHDPYPRLSSCDKSWRILPTATSSLFDTWNIQGNFSLVIIFINFSTEDWTSVDETRAISNSMSNSIYTSLRETLRYKLYHQWKQCPVTSRGVGKRLAARSSTMVTPGAALRISLAVSFKIHMHKAHKFRRCTNTTGSKHHFDFHSHP